VSPDSSSLTDVGPATPAPSWCLSDVIPQWDELTERAGGGVVCTWLRDVSDGVWITGYDRIVDGRVMRTAPRIVCSELPMDGSTSEQARELAAGLVAAADIIACAAFDEAAR
jgi:hypothetical protein